MKPEYLHFFIDPSRCIGCQACPTPAPMRHAPRRVDDPFGVRRTRREHSDGAGRLHATAISRPAPKSVLPMRSNSPVTASCRRSRRPRCIACGNCVVACPSACPRSTRPQNHDECDMCYDRTSVGRSRCAATVCPSQALFFGTHAQDRAATAAVAAVNRFQFGGHTITTQVQVMITRARVVTRAGPCRCHGGDGRAPAAVAHAEGTGAARRSSDGRRSRGHRPICGRGASAMSGDAIDPELT